jgi:nonsense-mediated mRNA decay protein 3
VARASDFGKNSQTFFVRTHLGFILKPGDVVQGYDLTTSNWNNAEYTEYAQHNAGGILPDVILVRKSYDHLRRQGAPRRQWKLKQLPMDVDDDTKGPTVTVSDRDRERFMQELEEDSELRSAINLYRDASAMRKSHGATRSSAMDVVSATETESESVAGDIPRVSLEELLEDLTIDE